MKNIEYLKVKLSENFEKNKDRIDFLYKELEELEKLPNDCKGFVMSDGYVIENNDYKLDIMTNYYHQIGYLTCLNSEFPKIIKILNMSDEEMNQYIKEELEIEKKNEKYLNEIFNRIKKKLNNE